MSDSTKLERRVSPGELLPPEPHYTSPGMLRTMVRVNAIFGVALIGVLAIATVLPPLQMLVFALGGIGFAGIWLFRAIQAAKRNVAAGQELKAGRVDEAAETFEKLARKHQFHPHHPLFVHNRATCYLVNGELKRAVSLFNAARRSEELQPFTAGRTQDYPTTQFALALALLGEHQEGDRILSEVEDDTQHEVFGLTVLPRAVIMLRSGHPQEAVDHLTRHWSDAEGLAGSRTAKALRVVRAFALEQTGGDAGEIEQLMAGISPYEPREIEWLWVEWPELKSFCETHL